MTPLNPTLLAHGNPGLLDDEDDDGSDGHGIARALIASGVVWWLGWIVVRWWL